MHFFFSSLFLGQWLHALLASLSLSSSPPHLPSESFSVSSFISMRLLFAHSSSMHFFFSSLFLGQWLHALLASLSLSSSPPHLPSESFSVSSMRLLFPHSSSMHFFFS